MVSEQPAVQNLGRPLGELTEPTAITSVPEGALDAAGADGAGAAGTAVAAAGADGAVVAAGADGAGAAGAGAGAGAAGAGAAGAAAAGAARLVATSLEDEDEGVSDAAARTLTLLGPTAIPELVRALESSSTRARRLACFALGTMAASARPAIPGLKKLLEDPEEDIRELAKMAIQNILLNE